MFKKSSILLSLALLAAGCTSAAIVNVGQGFETHNLFAPWDGLKNDTRFCCHSTADRFFFSFEVSDSSQTLAVPFLSERDIDNEDRVEIFFCPASGMKKGYHCAEIDPCGRIKGHKTKCSFIW